MTGMDKITEEISHFIGLFHITVEEAQIRNVYTDFAYYAQQEHLKSQPFIPQTFDAPYEFVGFDPSVAYKAPFYTSPLWHPSLAGAHGHPPIPVFRPDPEFSPTDPPEHELSIVQPGRPSLVLEIDPPGSVANYIVQAASLSDDDQFNVGGSGLTFNPDPIDNAEALAVAEAAFDLAPLDRPEMPGSSAEIIDYIDSIVSQLQALASETAAAPDVSPVSPVPEAFVEQSTVIEGIYVNGELVEEAPVLEDYITFDEDAEAAEDGADIDGVDEGSSTATDEPAAGGKDDGPPGNVVISPDGSATIEDSVELVAGGNVVVNEAVVQNLWTGATVTAVVGDHIEVNTIIQTNVIQDTDAITSAVNGWTGGDVPDELFNIATFQRTDPLEDNPEAHSADGGFPAAWAITEIQGDLMITNWLEQYIFMSDNDIGIFSSSGVTTSVVAGDNTSVNHTSIFELSTSYDLIIVGGSSYDANIIHQTNVLLDNDVVHAASDFETTGAGTISASDNLLWNQALIYNIGGADRFEELPSAYLDAANDLAAGGNQLSSSVLSDPAFAGLSGLRVLYISGDLLNIQYISQTAIVGDSDQIALAMNAVHPDADATWSVSSGGNALINNAAILDLDSLGHTYVGGEQYSQETLFQAEFISHRTDLLGLDPNALANEAVLFLDDTMLEDSVQSEGSLMPTEHDGHYQNDGLQHVLG